MRQKTNGLWQSWVVSICEGCDDQKPYGTRRLEDWPARRGRYTTGPADSKAAGSSVHHVESRRAEVRRHGSLEANLSTENIDAIRRMPQQ